MLVAERSTGARTLRLDVVIVGVAITYVSISTADVKLAGIPIKLIAVGVALVTWGAVARPWRRDLSAFRFRYPILLTGLVVPIVWLGVAVVLHAQHDQAQRFGLGNALQEGSRFLYLLLYFPLADRGWLGARWDWLWMVPAFLLCGVNLGLFFGHVLGADYGQSGTVGPFQGTIGVDPLTGVFRDDLVNDILLLPLFAVLLATAIRKGVSVALVAGMALVFGIAYLAHTRGIWIGMCVTVAVAATAALPRGRLEPIRVAAFGALALGWLAALVLLADPTLAGTGLLNANELSTASRLDQAPQLLAGVRRHVVLGSGLGAALPSGYVRDPAIPWVFELTYLQLLFQVGVIGLLCVLGPAAATLVKLGGKVRRTRLADSPRVFAVMGALAGFLLTAADNPYLLASVGMYTLALLVVLTERELARLDGEAPVGPSIGSGPLLAYRRLPPTWAIGVIAVSIAALTALEFRAPRRTFTALRQSQPLPQIATLALPQSRPLPAGALVSDSGLLGSSTIWAFASRAGHVFVTPIALEKMRLVTRPTEDLGVGPAGAPVGFAVSAWSSPRQLAAFELASSGNALTLRIVSLGTRAAAPLAVRQVRLSPPGRGSVRQFAVVSAHGSLPDLFVLDRGSGGAPTRLQIYSGASGFRARVLDQVLPISSLSPPAWSVAFGALAAPSVDLLFATRSPRTRTGLMEVHVLRGDADYLRFGEQAPIALPAGDSSSMVFLLTHVRGVPALYGIDRRHSRAVLLSLVPAPEGLRATAR